MRSYCRCATEGSKGRTRIVLSRLRVLTISYETCMRMRVSILTPKAFSIRSAISPDRSALPLSRLDRAGREIWGDNKLVLASLKNGALRQEIEKAGGLKLVYIDPPFDVGADFSFDIEVGDGENLTKEPSVIEEVAYRDTARSI